MPGGDTHKNTGHRCDRRHPTGRRLAGQPVRRDVARRPQLGLCSGARGRAGASGQAGGDGAIAVDGAVGVGVGDRRRTRVYSGEMPLHAMIVRISVEGLSGKSMAMIPTRCEGLLLVS